MPVLVLFPTNGPRRSFIRRSPRRAREAGAHPLYWKPPKKPSTGGGALMRFRRLTVPILAALALLAVAAEAGAQPCLIFVHGKQTDTNTFTSYTAARNYWVNGTHDFV